MSKAIVRRYDRRYGRSYLADIIDRMVKDHPINRLNELLPWNWNRQAERLAA